MKRYYLFVLLAFITFMLACTTKSREKSDENNVGCVYRVGEVTDSTLTIGDILDSADVYKNKVQKKHPKLIGCP